MNITLEAKFVSAAGGGRLNNSCEDMNTVCDLIKLAPLTNSRLFNKEIPHGMHMQLNLENTQPLSKWYIKAEEADPEPWIKCEQDTQKLTERLRKKTASADGSMSQDQPSDDDPDNGPSGPPRTELPDFQLDHLQRACLGASHYAAPYATGTIFKAAASSERDGLI
ncbi:hypothetical protein LTS15_004935 [Exophiala xenobiotica]|nr:hypothetical protein LTS15_004935 [Exophiala xenobiotica]